MTAVKRTATLLLAAALLLIPAPAAHSADIQAPNNGFENDLTGWTQFTSTPATVTTERAFEGAKSAKLNDTGTGVSTGIESTRLAAAGGTRYAAFARVYAVSGIPDLYLRFHNGAGEVTTSLIRFSGTLNTWTTLRVTGTAPEGTVSVSVMGYSSVANVGVAYFDNMLLTKTKTDLGTQIQNSQLNGTTFGVGAQQDRVYGIFTGTTEVDARLVTIDVNTERAVGSSLQIPGAIGGWAATTATDGKVYLGSYNTAHLYQYDPNAASPTVRDLGQSLSGQTFVWCLTPGADGRVYGGTSNDAGYFKYDTGGMTQLSTKPILPNKQFVRGIAFDPAEEATYLGVGTKAALVRFDRITGSKVDILPEKYRTTQEIASGLTFTGGRLFVTLSDGTLSVLNVVEAANGSVTTTEEATFRSALHVSPARNGKVFVVNGGALHSYDIAAKTFTPVGVPVGVTVTEIGWVRLADQTAYPGETLVIVGHQLGRTHLVKYNPTNGAVRTAEVLGTPNQPTAINSLGTAPDGRIFSGGFLTGGTGIYRPLRGDTNDANPDEVHYGLSQTDSILSHNGKMYFGNYPGARVQEYDPTAPWQVGTNPRQIASFSGDKQDRPYALAAGGGRLFVGTVPLTGEVGGALSVIDLASGNSTVMRNIVLNQSITALAYHNGKVYGGTSIRSGQENPTATAAKFFVYDPVTGAKTEYSLPAVRTLTAVTALAVVDGRIWGFAEGFLFIFNPATNTFSTNPVDKFPGIRYTGGTWRDAYLATTPVDTTSVYGTIGNYLFKINKSTLMVSTFFDTGADGLTVDEYGNLYYYNASTLTRYVP